MEVVFVYDAVYPYVRGGAERRYFEFGRRLAARGHVVRQVSWQYWDGGAVQRNQDGVWLHGVGAPRPLHDNGGRRTFSEALAFAIRSARVVARLEAPLIDCSSIPYAPAIALHAMKRHRAKKLVVSWHEYMGERWNSYLGTRAPVARAVERGAAECGDMRIAVSTFTRDRMPGGPPVAVVPNGTDVRRIAAVNPSSLRSDVIVIGRLVPHKRVDVLLQVLKIAPDLTATIIGDGPEYGRLQQRAWALGVNERVRFTGRLESDEDVVALTKSAGCLLLTSEQEGFGMTVVEAMAAGTPPVIVRSPSNGATHLVRHGYDGLIVDRDPGPIADAIRDVVRDGGRRAQLSENAAATARGYDWETLTDSLVAHYSHLMRAPRTGSDVLTVGAA